MAIIMCFSLMFGAAAATTDGEQIMPSTSAVSPTQAPDIGDQVGGMIGDIAGDQLGQAGQDIMDGMNEAHGFLASVQRIIDNLKVLLSNFINTVFTFFNIGTGDSLFG